MPQEGLKSTSSVILFDKNLVAKHRYILPQTTLNKVLSNLNLFPAIIFKLKTRDLEK